MGILYPKLLKRKSFYWNSWFLNTVCISGRIGPGGVHNTYWLEFAAFEYYKYWLGCTLFSFITLAYFKIFYKTLSCRSRALLRLVINVMKAGCFAHTKHSSINNHQIQSLLLLRDSRGRYSVELVLYTASTKV